MSMDLTEPDAGSDLQSVMLKATYDEANNCWRLNGVKRFITNGDANLHLVLARSEEGTKDGRGLSMFIYDKNEGGVDVRRIENSWYPRFSHLRAGLQECKGRTLRRPQAWFD